MLWNLFVIFHLASADVIRDESYHNYEGQFTVVNKGRMLRVLMYFNNLPIKACALHCVRHLRCKTINYNHVKKACELTDEDFDEMNAETISPGWYNHGTPPKVDGGWSSWRSFTECTKTCESGTLEERRDCDSPIPKYGGAYCQGSMIRKLKCNTHGCKAVNVALNKVTKQSSDQHPANLISSMAVDGIPGTRSVTRQDYDQWWEIDLGKVIVIKEISLDASVHYRSNQGLVAETRQDDKENWILCYDIGNVDEKVTKFKCSAQSAKARFLKIRSTKRCHLGFNEVEISAYTD